MVMAAIAPLAATVRAGMAAPVGPVAMVAPVARSAAGPVALAPVGADGPPPMGTVAQIKAGAVPAARARR